ncbi:metallo-beta-lactamase superfamily protein [Trichoderma gamsii]|uniref:Metallo-beta-lactamase superfamily protein n=1 Tax=Trichoderma gamsii TaxID=398673 RepID=A0A2P4Z7Q0_9HYPO|nr:metallo-beta-lactamase superfamily protein [Trichoderma gamsii]PON20301.1 metallo-beta-lactamase superfamily protein [Trichoderma gamsii]
MQSDKPIAQNRLIQAFVYIEPPIPVQVPGHISTEDFEFSPTSFTLITTPNEAVLVDAPPLVLQGERLAKWIAAILSGRKLSTIYVTHGHGDHFFSAGLIQKRFPGARIRATKETFIHMQEHLSDKMFDGIWTEIFNDLKHKGRPKLKVNVLPSRDNTFVVEGHRFCAIPVAGGDTVASTVLHMPDLNLIIAGDVIYGECHQHLGENPTSELRQKWLQAINQVVKLQPKVIVPSHMQPHEDFGLHHLENTRDYIKTWDEMVNRTQS